MTNLNGLAENWNGLEGYHANGVEQFQHEFPAVEWGREWSALFRPAGFEMGSRSIILVPRPHAIYDLSCLLCLCQPVDAFASKSGIYLQR
ncbi:hypothetical protein AVEN_192765-1 [Araneus ventricosus]|uniref:Uncharacterized protein n=1 Tax=Araneus ventricosus TaxID=182803 RepID=A0A4Y2U2R3_ARAVE|nr:hypothetical protein AVEN_192765-1 [Araneus ventricosus]